MEINVIKSKFLRNSFDQNTYVLSNKKEVVIIDAGAEIEDVLPLTKNKKVLAVFVTHLHFDHIWNIEKYVEIFDCDVYIQEGFENKFLNSRLNCSDMVRLDIQKNVSKKKIKYYAENLSLGRFDFKIISTPGHSADSVCILCEDKLFTGDTIFSDCIGRCDLYDSNTNDMIKSLNKIKMLDFSEAYPGHYENATKDQVNKTIDFYI